MQLGARTRSRLLKCASGWKSRARTFATSSASPPRQKPARCQKRRRLGQEESARQVRRHGPRAIEGFRRPVRTKLVGWESGQQVTFFGTARTWEQDRASTFISRSARPSATTAISTAAFTTIPLRQRYVAALITDIRSFADCRRGRHHFFWRRHAVAPRARGARRHHPGLPRQF